VSEALTIKRGFRVQGRVQGVGFRWSAARVAEGLGLKGSIRNAVDGSVEVSAEGSRETIEKFERWLSEGPRGAVVQRVDVIDAELPIPDSGFRIIR
jgi:acylphosphatase